MLTLIHPCPASGDLYPVRAQRRMQACQHFHSAVPLDRHLRAWLAQAREVSLEEACRLPHTVVLGVPDIPYDEWIPGLHPRVEEAVRQGIYPLGIAERPAPAWDPWLDLGVPVALPASASDLRAAGYPGEPLPLEGGCLTGTPRLWPEQLPLHGLRLIVTRAEADAPELVERLEQLGATVNLVPCLAFQPEDVRELPVEDYDWVVFTSANGVRFFFQWLDDVRRLKRARLAAIGPGTAAELRRRHLRADLVPAQYVAESLLEAFPEVAGQRILLPRAAEAREVLPEGLRSRGAQVDVVPVYRSVAPPPVPIDEGADRVLFTSSSTVKNFRRLTDLDLPVLAIGPVTAETARQHGFSVVASADPYTVEGMLDWLLRQ